MMDSFPSCLDTTLELFTSSGSGSLPDREKKALKFEDDLTADPDTVWSDSLDLLE